MRALAGPPWNLGQNDARRFDLLRDAHPFPDCELAYPFPDMLCELARPPWSLGDEDARRDNARVLRLVCTSENCTALQLLGGPPWNLGQADARAEPLPRTGVPVWVRGHRAHAEPAALVARSRGRPRADGVAHELAHRGAGRLDAAALHSERVASLSLSSQAIMHNMPFEL